ncbi:AmmeMemoRadiSam system protein A [Patescibacteria group bacterium]|nr:AmmeMemoRadiSam system protein A [Patescibacteria group bacterium]MBU1890735.1 AmmeMemoRadiSam system protein A [Patescibacteria group bacterium]
MNHYTRLARKAIETYLNDKKVLGQTADLPEEMTQRKAGVFVSLHKNDELRGCIGTIYPSQNNLADEIIQNAISAATKDMRFYPLDLSELPIIHISVDILSEPIEAVKEDLDIKKYGIIVKNQNKTGVLLPDIDGIDSVDQQISIACEKAGIISEVDGYQLYKFIVKRYSE